MGNPIEMHLASVQNIIQKCDNEGADGDGLESLRSLMQKAVDARSGDGSIAEVAKLIT